MNPHDNRFPLPAQMYTPPGSFPPNPPASGSDSWGLQQDENLGLQPVPRLWRSRSNRVLAGVIGGLSEKYDLDSRPIRLLYAAVSLFSGGLALLPYVVMWAVTHVHGPPSATPRFWRSRRSKMVAGVIGGLAEKLDVGETPLRVGYCLATIFTGVFPGMFGYLIAWACTKSFDPARPYER